jgi:Ni/Co efflux regulator RcnB
MTKILSAAAAVAMVLAVPALAQDFQHQRRIPHRPDRPSIRETVTKRFNEREEHLTRMLKQRQDAVDDHHAGRRLLEDKVR